jgi:hypothetical protein
MRRAAIAASFCNACRSTIVVAGHFGDALDQGGVGRSKCVAVKPHIVFQARGSTTSAQSRAPIRELVGGGDVRFRFDCKACGARSVLMSNSRSAMPTWFTAS